MSTNSYILTNVHSLPRAIAHVDADCFFASVSLLQHPELKGKPVMICNRTDGRGIVVSATYEARAFAIRAGTPVFQAKKLCPNGILLPSDFEEYEAMSFRLMSLLRGFSPDVEACSIDEAFVDLTGLRLLYRTDYAGIAALMQETVQKKLGISVSVGIGSSKLLAKIASDYKKPGGLTIVTEKNREAFLKTVPICNIPGVGKNTEALLKKFGIEKAGDIAARPDIERILGKRGAVLFAELNGCALSSVHTSDALPKSLSCTRTFHDFSRDKKYIFSFSVNLLMQLTRRLRSYGLESALVGFFLLTKEFNYFGLKKKFSQPTDEDHFFLELFDELFDKTYKAGALYRKSGFFMSDFQIKGAKQLSLFKKNRSPSLDLATDRIYEKYGFRGISRGSAIFHQKNTL